MLDKSYYDKTDEIIEHYGRKASSLIPIMQDVQAEYRYLPGELLTHIAKEIGITETKAYSVATFYENFSFEAKGKYVIKVCDGTACNKRSDRHHQRTKLSRRACHTVNLRLSNDVHKDNGYHDSLEHQGLDNDKSHLNGVEGVHTRHGDTKEQQTLQCEYRRV